jgi:hypothetical protein
MFFGCPVRGEKNGIKHKERQRVGVLYIPLVPPEVRAAFHFVLASFMKTAAKLCSSLRSFGCRFRQVQVCCPERRHHPFARLAEQKV